ncbi:hypothetical protein OG225_08015 [Nocardia sp. NBC_01377]
MNGFEAAGLAVAAAALTTVAWSSTGTASAAEGDSWIVTVCRV